MADYTLTMADGDYSVDAVDSNSKIALDGSDLKLAPDGDNFGSSVDADWTEDDDPLSEGLNGQTWSESGGELLPVAAAGVTSRSTQRRNNLTYADFDTVMYVADGDYVAASSNEGAIHHWPWLDVNNFVYFDYYFQRNTATRNKRIYVGKRINGSYTTLYSADDTGQSELYFRIKRLTTSGPSNNYFYFYISTDGSSWTEKYSAQIRDATHFNESDVLYQQVGCYANRGGTTYEPQIGEFYQYTGDIAAQRFWTDSPEATLVESGQTYAFDADAGNIWSLTGASSTEDADGGSINYKGGYSDDGSTITWVDAGWVSIATLNTNAGNGDYDGHRYLHFKTQYVSDGTQRPEITDFTVSGTAAADAHTISQSSTQAKEGTYSRKHVGPAVVQSDKHCLQYITTTEGERFYVSGWVYCTVAPTTGNFYVKLYDETGTALIEESQISATTSGWRKVSFYEDAPASCVKMSLRVGGDVLGGTCYFDGIRAKRIRPEDYS